MKLIGCPGGYGCGEETDNKGKECKVSSWRNNPEKVKATNEEIRRALGYPRKIETPPLTK